MDHSLVLWEDDSDLAALIHSFEVHYMIHGTIRKTSLGPSVG